VTGREESAETAAVSYLVNHGRYLEACAQAQKLLKTNGALRIQQLYALALSKSGAPEIARDYLEKIYQTNSEDPETAGILAGIYKTLFRKNQQSAFAIRSRDTYLQNFNATKNTYTGINAAAMSAMVMQSARSKELAKEVIQLIAPATVDFWELATLGEAHLLLKEKSTAVEYYLKARKVAGTNWGRITSVYDQLWLLDHYQQVPLDVKKLFSPPRVAAFVGHMIDHPDRSVPRFPASIETNVKEAISSTIRRLQIQIGYCSLACGGDILFAEAMVEQGGEVVIQLPFDVDDFVNASVRVAGDDWVKRFERLAQKFPVTFITKEPYRGNDDLFALQGRVILGSAVLRSNLFHAEPALITVLSDIDLKEKKGGTRDIINHWPFPSQHTNINPESFLGPELSETDFEGRSAARSGVNDRPVQYMVLVDLTRLSGAEKLTFQALINNRGEGDDHGFLIFEDTPDVWVLSFDYETAAVEMVKIFLEAIRQMRSKPDIRVLLHAGPVQKTNGRITAGAFNMLKAMARVALPAAMCASGMFAALIALVPRLLTLEPVGSMLEEEDEGPHHSVYKVSLR
jgi:tetratricopeptide (TPR) repeat protein